MRSNLRLRDRLKQAVGGLESEREFGSQPEVQQGLRSVEEHKQFLSGFLRDLPSLTKELHSQVSTRRLAEILMHIVRQALKPEEAVILWRRGGAASKVGDLAVAIVHPAESRIQKGDALPIGRGEIGSLASH